MAQYHAEHPRSKSLTQKCLKRTTVRSTTKRLPEATPKKKNFLQHCKRPKSRHSNHKSHTDIRTTDSERLQFTVNCGSRVPNEAVKCLHKCRNRKKSPPYVTVHIHMIPGSSEALLNLDERVWPPSLRGKEIIRPDLQTDGLGIRPTESLSGSLVLAACCTQACPYAPCTSHPVANAQLIQNVELFLIPHEYGW